MMQSTHSTVSSGGTATPNNPDKKVLTDLSTLTDQINLCQSMLFQAGSTIDGDEALLTVISFLEDCVPRMVELIEAAATGALQPETFEECLVVNDELTNILSDVNKDPKDRQPMIVPAASAATTEFGIDDDSEVDDLVVEMGMKKLGIGNDDSTVPIAVAGGKTTGLDEDDTKDPFSGGPDLLSPTPITTESDPFSATSSAAASAGAVATKSDNDDNDDFDAFFRDRTSAAGGAGKQD